MNQSFIEYSETVTQIANVERELNKLFQAQTKSNMQPAYRCRDYNERQLIIVIPFDQLTLDNFTPEKIQAIRVLIDKYLELRVIQKNIELKMDKENAIENGIKASIMQGIGGF